MLYLVTVDGKWNISLIVIVIEQATIDTGKFPYNTPSS